MILKTIFQYITLATVLALPVAQEPEPRPPNSNGTNEIKEASHGLKHGLIAGAIDGIADGICQGSVTPILQSLIKPVVEVVGNAFIRNLLENADEIFGHARKKRSTESNFEIYPINIVERGNYLMVITKGNIHPKQTNNIKPYTKEYQGKPTFDEKAGNKDSTFINEVAVEMQPLSDVTEKNSIKKEEASSSIAFIEDEVNRMGFKYNNKKIPYNITTTDSSIVFIDNFSERDFDAHHQTNDTISGGFDTNATNINDELNADSVDSYADQLNDVNYDSSENEVRELKDTASEDIESNIIVLNEILLIPLPDDIDFNGEDSNSRGDAAIMRSLQAAMHFQKILARTKSDMKRNLIEEFETLLNKIKDEL